MASSSPSHVIGGGNESRGMAELVRSLRLIWVAPRAARALHELSTNAAKYGALSSDAGKVRIAWGTDGERRLLEWKEQGGPTVSEPRGRGVGSRLIEGGLAADPGGEASLSFQPDALRSIIVASLDAIRAREG